MEREVRPRFLQLPWSTWRWFLGSLLVLLLPVQDYYERGGLDGPPWGLFVIALGFAQSGVADAKQHVVGDACRKCDVAWQVLLNLSLVCLSFAVLQGFPSLRPVLIGDY